MGKIDFEAKTDRELNILTAQAVNAIYEEKLPEIHKELKELNGTVRNHETRIVKVETKQKISCSVNNPGMQNRLLDKLTSIGSGYVGAILTIAAVVGIVYSIGRVCGWWN